MPKLLGLFKGPRNNTCSQPLEDLTTPEALKWKKCSHSFGSAQSDEDSSLASSKASKNSKGSKASSKASSNYANSLGRAVGPISPLKATHMRRSSTATSATEDSSSSWSLSSPTPTKTSATVVSPLTPAALEIQSFRAYSPPPTPPPNVVPERSCLKGTRGHKPRRISKQSNEKTKSGRRERSKSRSRSKSRTRSTGEQHQGEVKTGSRRERSKSRTRRERSKSRTRLEGDNAKSSTRYRSKSRTRRHRSRSRPRLQPEKEVEEPVGVSFAPDTRGGEEEDGDQAVETSFKPASESSASISPASAGQDSDVVDDRCPTPLLSNCKGRKDEEENSAISPTSVMQEIRLDGRPMDIGSGEESSVASELTESTHKVENLSPTRLSPGRTPPNPISGAVGQAYAANYMSASSDDDDDDSVGSLDEQISELLDDYKAHASRQQNRVKQLRAAGNDSSGSARATGQETNVPTPTPAPMDLTALKKRAKTLQKLVQDTIAEQEEQDVDVEEQMRDLLEKAKEKYLAGRERQAIRVMKKVHRGKKTLKKINAALDKLEDVSEAVDSNIRKLGLLNAVKRSSSIAPRHDDDSEYEDGTTSLGAKSDTSSADGAFDGNASSVSLTVDQSNREIANAVQNAMEKLELDVTEIIKESTSVHEEDAEDDAGFTKDEEAKLLEKLKKAINKD